MQRVKALHRLVWGAPMAATEPEQLPETPTNDDEEDLSADLPEDIKQWIDDHRRQDA